MMKFGILAYDVFLNYFSFGLLVSPFFGLPGRVWKVRRRKVKSELELTVQRTFLYQVSAQNLSFGPKSSQGFVVEYKIFSFQFIIFDLAILSLVKVTFSTYFFLSFLSLAIKVTVRF